MNSIPSAHNSSYSTSPQVIQEMLRHATRAEFRAGDMITRQGRICQHVFLLQSGLVKNIASTNEREYILNFFSEGFFFTEIGSFTHQCPAESEFQAIEPCQVYMISRDTFEALCAENQALNTALRLMVQAVLASVATRLTNRIKLSASERYELFLKQNPHLANRISLSDMANYLGITQVSLSRIRAQR